MHLGKVKKLVLSDNCVSCQQRGRETPIRMKHECVQCFRGCQEGVEGAGTSSRTEFRSRLSIAPSPSPFAPSSASSLPSGFRRVTLLVITMARCYGKMQEVIAGCSLDKERNSQTVQLAKGREVSATECPPTARAESFEDHLPAKKTVALNPLIMNVDSPQELQAHSPFQQPPTTL